MIIEPLDNIRMARPLRSTTRGILFLWVLATFTACIVYLGLREENQKLETYRSAGEEDDDAKPKHAVKKILYWNSFFEYEDYVFGFGRTPFVRSNCPVDNCHVTNRRDEGPRVEDFDAIIFHAWRLGWVTKRALSARRRPHQRYVFFLMEPPTMHHARLDHLPDFFNWTMSYRLDSDIYRPYNYFAPRSDARVYVDLSERRDPIWAISGNATRVSSPSEKGRHVAWFVSNCRTQSKRELYVQELSKHVEVDIYGRCGSLECPQQRSGECLRMLEDRYKFYLSFENSLCEDYVTEKLFSAMEHGVVPVVYGGADYERVVPPGSYIDTRDFASPKELAEHLKFLDANPAEYAKYFRWRQSYTIRHDAMSLAMCKLCAMLNDRTQPPKTYSDIHQWFEGPDVCHQPSSHWNAPRRKNTATKF